MTNLSIGAMTLGCKVNQYETEKMLTAFSGEGYIVKGFDEKCDVYLINTCTVTHMADKKSRQMIAKAKKNNNDALVVAVGCYVDASEKTVQGNENVDLYVKNSQKGEIVDIVNNYVSTKNTCLDSMSSELDINHTRALLKIQDGCNMFCSYCIIPYVRGRSISYDKDAIIDEYKKLVSSGYKEVVITGIHISSFNNASYRLIDLLEDLDKISPDMRIRLGSLEPLLVTEDFAKRVSKLRSVCPHFHLSLQSGSDSVLRLMNRKYLSADFKEATDYLKMSYENVSITTDIIVGFNGETEENFAETVKFVQEVDFYDIHVFKYSQRRGTKAAKMRGKIDNKTKSSRSKVLIALKEKINVERRRKMIGTTLDVLLEETVKHDDANYMTGYSREYVKVYIPDEETIGKNDILKVEVSELYKDGVLARKASRR